MKTVIVASPIVSSILCPVCLPQSSEDCIVAYLKALRDMRGQPQSKLLDAKVLLMSHDIPSVSLTWVCGRLSAQRAGKAVAILECFSNSNYCEVCFVASFYLFIIALFVQDLKGNWQRVGMCKVLTYKAHQAVSSTASCEMDIVSYCILIYTATRDIFRERALGTYTLNHIARLLRVTDGVTCNL